MQNTAPSHCPALFFHEATVVGWVCDATSGELRLQGVLSDTGLHSATVRLEDVSSCEVDGQAVERLAMEAADGEVLTLHVRDDGIELIVEWNEWSPARQLVRTYDVHAGSVVIDLTP